MTILGKNWQIWVKIDNFGLKWQLWVKHANFVYKIGWCFVSQLFVYIGSHNELSTLLRIVAKKSTKKLKDQRNCCRAKKLCESCDIKVKSFFFPFGKWPLPLYCGVFSKDLKAIKHDLNKIVPTLGFHLEHKFPFLEPRFPTESENFMHMRKLSKN